MEKYVIVLVGALGGAVLALASCSSDNNQNPVVAHDAGDDSAPNPDGGGTDGNVGDGGACLKPFTAPNKSGYPAGTLLLTASGESLAEQGYNFPDMPANGVFADGWEVRFHHFIATFDKVTVSNNPDKVPTDQSQTDQVVAQATGPWVIDLSKPTMNDVPGKEQGETATPFAVISNQNKNGGAAFDTTGGTKYAVGFSAVTATCDAIDVNLDTEGKTIYQDMIAKGCVVLYAGTATFKGDPNTCTQGTDPEFARFPPVVNFYLCFKSPTDYINCDNQDITGTPFGMEPHPRGIVFPNNTFVTGEITFHTDHPFWESVVHDTPAHFDQFAARVAYGDGGAPDGGAVPTVTMDDLVGADYLAYTDQLGNPVKWRSCVKDSMGMQYGQSTGPMSFDPQSVPKAPVGPNPTTAGLRDYYDYSTYNQSTQGHWNGVDGLCFVKRNYPAPH